MLFNFRDRNEEVFFFKIKVERVCLKILIKVLNVILFIFCVMLDFDKYYVKSIIMYM